MNIVKQRNNFFFISMGILLMVILMNLSGLFTVVKVNGHSMDPNLEVGEKLLVRKNKLGFDIEYKDVVIFWPPIESDELFIKRVIGVPGDRVEMKDDVLYINNKEIDEEYLKSLRNIVDEGDLLTENFGPISLNKDEYFVLGDNRLNSLDSRTFGVVTQDRIVGRLFR